MILDPITPTKDIILDEWAAEDREDNPFCHTDEVGLGIYMIHEPNAVIPNPVKDQNQPK